MNIQSVNAENRAKCRLLTVERLPDAAALEAIAVEWEELHASLSPCAPFASPLWNTLWWKYFAEDRFFIRDELFVLVIRNECRTLVAVAPMMLTHRPGSGPVRLRELQFFGSDVNITELRGIVCQEALQTEVLDVLLKHLLEIRAKWDWVQWCGIRLPSAATISTPARGGASNHRQVPSYYLKLPATWEEFKSRLSRNIKESLRKCYNSLKRDGHAFTFRVVEQPQDVGPALDRFFELHAARADAGFAVLHANVFAAERARNFLREYADRLAQRGQLRIFQLEIGGTVIATRVGFVFGKELYLYYSGYDSAWGKYSVMTTVVAEAIAWAIREHFTIVNLSTGNDISKTRWDPSEIVFYDYVQQSHSRFSSVAYWSYNEMSRLKNSATPLGRLFFRSRRAG